jgi:putative transposase
VKFDPQIHHRRSIRLKGYDYSQPGAYFVTLVAYLREALFGEITDGMMRLNRCGEILHRGWLDLPRHYPHVTLDAFVIMPNHVHAILVLRADDGRGGSVRGQGSMQTDAPAGENLLLDIVQTRPYKNDTVPQTRHSLSEDVELNRIRQYIQNNPPKWAEDQENPARSG